jgi:hypothetical protein
VTGVVLWRNSRAKIQSNKRGGKKKKRSKKIKKSGDAESDKEGEPPAKRIREGWKTGWQPASSLDTTDRASIDQFNTYILPTIKTPKINTMAAITAFVVDEEVDCSRWQRTIKYQVPA